MKRACVIPLLLSTLAFGPVVLLSESAQAATPSMTCSLTSTNGKFNAKATGVPPDVRVQFTTKNDTGAVTKTVTADDTGTAISSGSLPTGGPVTAKQGDQKVTCGTVKEAEQQDAQAEYRKGFRQGLADTRDDCKAKQPDQGLAAADPNFTKGYTDGSAAGLASAACKDK
ncbi:hypothetical protein [Streptomyces sp. NPDC002602]|uniref:hypothetical protein n=1 Tax=Streptomyces sp. NPDC002602 TaxID=3364654 RepID=UPI00368CCF6A